MKQTTYHQEKIRPFLVKYLTDARKRIHLAIGWINDIGLEGLLQKKVLQGVDVSLVLIKDQDYDSKLTALQELTKKGVRIITLGKEYREYLIDHKFGLIDNSIVLTGNYAWGYRNAPTEDHLSITEKVPSLTAGFEHEFEDLRSGQIKKKKSKSANPIERLLKRMEIVKTFLRMGDTEYIELHFEELQHFRTDRNVALIFKRLLNEEYEEALELIKTFTQYHQALRECIEPPIDQLRREIKLLEDEIASTSNEFSETQKKVHQFSKMHTNLLGGLLQDLLYQTKIKASIQAKQSKEDEEKQEEYEEAKNDHEEYTKSYEVSKKQKLNILTKKEQKELKKLYRQTSLKCHPDRVVEELSSQAEEIFVQLNEAYRANDLERVREINLQLKPGIMLPKSEGITELKKLESTYKNLVQKLEDWQEKLDQLQEDPSYKTIKSIEDWDRYFAERKELLEQQLERLIQFNEANTKILELE